MKKLEKILKPLAFVGALLAGISNTGMSCEPKEARLITVTRANMYNGPNQEDPYQIYVTGAKVTVKPSIRINGSKISLDEETLESDRSIATFHLERGMEYEVTAKLEDSEGNPYSIPATFEGKDYKKTYSTDTKKGILDEISQDEYLYLEEIWNPVN